MTDLAVCLIFGYLIGSVNFSIVYSHLKGDDIRRHGSKNAGATNILRTYGKLPALFVFLCDVLKGVVAVLAAKFVFADMSAQCLAALGAILGHNFPIYYSFSGGKGVSTSFAAFLALDWRVALCALAIFAVTVICFRYVSLSSIVSAVSITVFAYIFHGADVFFAFSIVVAILCVVRHRANIRRLLSGTENKLGSKKRSADL